MDPDSPEDRGDPPPDDPEAPLSPDPVPQPHPQQPPPPPLEHRPPPRTEAPPAKPAANPQVETGSTDAPPPTTSSQPEGPRQTPKRRKATPLPALPPATHQQWVRDHAAEVPLSKLEWDEDASQGQIRPLNYEQLADRLNSLRIDPPTVPIRVTLWPTDVLGVPPSLRVTLSSPFP